MCKSGCFLIVETGRETDEILLGVAAGVTLALTALLPGTVMESRLDLVPNLLGVAGAPLKDPSLVVGLLPPLLDMAEAGLNGGGMLLSALKKLDLRLPFERAGDDGKFDRLSMVLSDNEGRDFLLGGSPASSTSGSGLGSLLTRT